MSTTAANAGLNPALALAVAQQESGFNPNAVSKAGAQGVMQLMPGTAAQLGVTNPLDPAQNVQGGVTYLNQLLAQFGGDQAKALAAYNWGPANVQNAVAQFGSNWLLSAPAETQNYVSSIMASTGGATASSLIPSSSASTPGVDTSTDLSSDVLASLLPTDTTTPLIVAGALLALAGIVWAVS